MAGVRPATHVGRLMQDGIVPCTSMIDMSVSVACCSGPADILWRRMRELLPHLAFTCHRRAGHVHVFLHMIDNHFRTDARSAGPVYYMQYGSIILYPPGYNQINAYLFLLKNILRWTIWRSVFRFRHVMNTASSDLSCRLGNGVFRNSKRSS